MRSFTKVQDDMGVIHSVSFFHAFALDVVIGFGFKHLKGVW